MQTKREGSHIHPVNGWGKVFMSALLTGPLAVTAAHAQEDGKESKIAFAGGLEYENTNADVTAESPFLPAPVTAKFEQEHTQISAGGRWTVMNGYGDLRALEATGTLRNADETYAGGALRGSVVMNDRVGVDAWAKYSDQRDNLLSEENGWNAGTKVAVRVFGHTAVGFQADSLESGDSNSYSVGARTDIPVGPADMRFEVALGKTSEGGIYRGQGGIENLGSEKTIASVTLRQHLDDAPVNSVFIDKGAFLQLAYLNEKGDIGLPFLGKTPYETEAVQVRLGFNF